MILILVTINKFSTIFAVQNKFVGLYIYYYSLYIGSFFENFFFAFDFNDTYSLSLYRHLHQVQGSD